MIMIRKNKDYHMIYLLGLTDVSKCWPQLLPRHCMNREISEHAGISRRNRSHKRSRQETSKNALTVPVCDHISILSSEVHTMIPTDSTFFRGEIGQSLKEILSFSVKSIDLRKNCHCVTISQTIDNLLNVTRLVSFCYNERFGQLFQRQVEKIAVSLNKYFNLWEKAI